MRWPFKMKESVWKPETRLIFDGIGGSNRAILYLVNDAGDSAEFHLSPEAVQWLAEQSIEYRTEGYGNAIGGIWIDTEFRMEFRYARDAMAFKLIWC